MSEEEKKETQEVTPEWAKKLTESMDKVVDSLSHLSPQEDDPNRTIEIPVPQEPPKEEPEVIPTEEPAPQEEPKKKRKFLDWLL